MRPDRMISEDEMRVVGQVVAVLCQLGTADADNERVHKITAAIEDNTWVEKRVELFGLYEINDLRDWIDSRLTCILVAV